MLFNAFLLAALAALFLSVAHAPAMFAENVREEYYMGIDLVKGFSKDSYVGKRLWKQLRLLIEVGPRLGLTSTSKDRDHDRRPSHQVKGELDPSRSAAVAMAGLAGHNVDEMALFSGAGWAGETNTSTSPEALAADLTSLFEAAGAFGPMGGQGGIGNGQGGLFDAMGGNDGFGIPSEEVSNIFKELF